MLIPISSDRQRPKEHDFLLEKEREREGEREDAIAIADVPIYLAVVTKKLQCSPFSLALVKVITLWCSCQLVCTDIVV